ncbi:MAG: hypothetical protein B6I23_00800 [Rickettsiaceae bacterium 4572_127]|nr:MAG: hypothetical protein B6I23_00800 [Rickettsiaceae bacterium 4572_127]
MKYIMLFLFLLIVETGKANDNYPQLDLELAESENYIILEAKLKKFRISDGFQAYQFDDIFFVPFSEIATGFEFPIVVDAFEGTASGWFMDEGREVEIDLKRGHAVSNSQSISLTKENTLWGEDDIYIRSDLLEKFFPLTVSVDDSALILNMESLEAMPFEQKIIREKKQKMIDKNKTEKLLYTEPFIETSAWVTFPFLDFGLTIKHEKDSEQTAQNASYSLSGNGILFGLDSSFNYFGTTQSEEQYLRFQLSRFTPVGGIAGIKYLEMGDASSYNMKLISGASSGRGISFSSFNEKGNSVDREFQLTGMLTDGWEVELYQNNILKDFSAGKDGAYDFEEIDLALGSNKLKLVFYGSQGEIREEETNIFLSPTSVEEGDFDFRFFAQEINMPTIELDESKSAGYKIGGYLEYGLTPKTALTFGGISYIPPEIEEAEDDDEEEEEETTDEEETGREGHDQIRGMIGLKTGFSIFRLGLNSAYTEYSESPAVEGILDTDLGIYNLTFEHGIFNGMRTEKSYIDGAFLTSKSKVNLRGRIKIPYIGIFPFLSRYTVANNLENEKYEEIKNTLSFGWWRFYLSTENIVKIKFDGYKEDTLNSTLNFRMGKASLRGTSRYDMIEKYIQSTSLGLDFKILGGTFCQANWGRAMTKDSNEVQDNYSLSASQSFDFGSLMASTSTASDGSFSFKLTYNASLLNDTQHGRFKLARAGLSQKGVVHATTYLDENYDGEFTEEDTIIKGIRYKAIGVIQERDEEMKHKKTCLKGAKPYELTSFKIDKNTIEDMENHPADEQKVVLARRGVLTEINLGLVKQGEIDGELKVRNDEGFDALSGIKVIVFDGEKKVAETISDQDGYYLFSNLNPKNYTIKLDEQQVISLELIHPETIIFELRKEDLYKTIKTIYVEKLYKDEPLEEENGEENLEGNFES